MTIQEVRTIALSKEINLRYFDNGDVGISVDETTTQADATLILNLFAVAAEEPMHDVCAIPGKAPASEHIPHSRSLPEVSHRNGNDALHQTSGTEGYLVGSFHDFFGFLYHEIECGIRNAAS